MFRNEIIAIIRFMKENKSVCIRYVLEVIALIILCTIHVNTKYYDTARTILEVFYWPEGPCINMAVVGAIFAILPFAIKNEYLIVKRIFGERRKGR